MIKLNDAYDEQNIFAKILRGEMPNITLYEDDKTLPFMDIMPQAWAIVWSSRRSLP